MSILDRFNPFRRKCCEVLLISGDYNTPGSTVSGIAAFDGHEFEFIGVALGDGVDQDKVGNNLDVMLSMLSKAGVRGAWAES